MTNDKNQPREIGAVDHARAAAIVAGVILKEPLMIENAIHEAGGDDNPLAVRNLITVLGLDLAVAVVAQHGDDAAVLVQRAAIDARAAAEAGGGS